jgi:hypothetical protein
MYVYLYMCIYIYIPKYREIFYIEVYICMYIYKDIEIAIDIYVYLYN